MENPKIVLDIRLKKPQYRSVKKFGLEDLVCSPELAKELKRSNVAQKSFWYWADYIPPMGKPDLKRINEITAYDELFSAFTCAELGLMLPWIIYIGDSEYRLKIYKRGSLWTIIYKNSDKNIFFSSLKEADARAKMVLFLINRQLLQVR